MKTCFISIVLILAASGGAPAESMAEKSATPQRTLEALRAERTERAHRKRRLIYNNDGGELGLGPFIDRGVVSREAFLAERMSRLAGSQVDAIFYSTGAGIGVFFHNTKIGTFPEQTANGRQTMRRAYLDAGLDSLQMSIDFARNHGMEAFWSLRMNDTHDGAVAEYGPGPFARNAFKNKHPEFLLGAYDPAKPRQSKMWSAVNYALPEVRDYVLSVFGEVCRNYNIDGVELDFFRHLAFFKSAMEGNPATEEEIAAMNELVRRVRALTEEEGLKRGRPILVAVRVPDSIPYARVVGLDIETWLKEKWVDLLIPGGYFRLNPWQSSIVLGRQHGVPVYPSLDDPRIPAPEFAPSVRLRKNFLAYRGRALEAWEAGADGIYLFNIFLCRPKDELFRELGDPQTLAFLSKDYYANARGYAGQYGLSGEPYRDKASRSTLYPLSPVVLTAQPTSIPFPVGDDFAAARQAGKHPTVRVMLEFREPIDATHLTVSLNGTTIAPHPAEGSWLSAEVNPAIFKKGTNVLEIGLNGSGTAPVALLDLRAEVRYEEESQ